jgi:hypothetical protein
MSPPLETHQGLCFSFSPWRSSREHDRRRELRALSPSIDGSSLLRQKQAIEAMLNYSTSKESQGCTLFKILLRGKAVRGFNEVVAWMFGNRRAVKEPHLTPELVEYKDNAKTPQKKRVLYV